MRKKNRVSVYIKSQGPNIQAIKKGLSWLISICNSTQKCNALLAFLGKSQFRRVMSEVIDERVVKALAKGERIKLPNSPVELSLLTERQRFYSWDGPVLAIYPTKKLLDKIDGLFGVTHILVVPWYLEEIQFWIDTWSAHELGSPPPKAKKRLVSNPVVEEALRSLTARVNVSTGLSHPLDKASAIDLFKRLKAEGEYFDPNEVRAWLVAEGNWKPEHADEVAKVAKGIIEGKRLKGARRRWRKDIVKYWREEAESKKIKQQTP